MRPAIPITIALVAITIVGCTSEDIPAPAISTVTPDHAVAGVITLLGDFFCQQPESDDSDPFACANIGSVQVGQQPGNVGLYSEQMITVEIPGIAPGNVDIVVLVSGRRSNAIGFRVDAP